MSLFVLRATASPGAQVAERVLDAGHHHLGNDSTPEWSEASERPEGTRLELRFDARANPREWCLRLTQRSVGARWRILLNGEGAGELERCTDPIASHYPLPAGSLVEGENTLEIVPDDPGDDVVLGELWLIEAPLREALDLVPVEVRVRDADSGSGVPARVTVVDAKDQRARLYGIEDRRTAVRPGVVYTASGTVRFEIPRGAYRFFATRGVEWGLGRAERTLDAAATVELEIRREVPTRGAIACDTHVHTLTFSGHGDASVEERLVTLAGEGVELAVATDHNHHTDYGPGQAELGLSDDFVAVTGNEVTTEIGHFNAFPLDPAGDLPDHRLTDLIELARDIRARGARVVVLNHPRWPDAERGPFGVARLDPFTGERARFSEPLPVDAMELANATDRQEDPLLLFRDWFALLNRGERLAAVGSSDSHTVDDPVGQGRTYVASDSDDPRSIDLDQVLENLVAGRSTISMGLLCDVTVDGRFGPGERVPVAERRVHVRLRAAGPSWVRPTRALVFQNGRLVAEPRLPEHDDAAPKDLCVELDVELASGHDAWLVCVVLGEGIDGPWWTMRNDYTLAATNPVWLDVDRDGRYRSPRESARVILERTGPDVAAISSALAECDDAVGIHLLDLARLSWLEEARSRLEQAADGALHRQRLADWLASLPAAR